MIVLQWRVRPALFTFYGRWPCTANCRLARLIARYVELTEPVLFDQAR